MKDKVLFLFALICAVFLYADDNVSPTTPPTSPPTIQPYAPPAPPEPPPTPWFTGPLIVPVSAVIPYGDFEIQSYLYCTTNTGAYNQHWSSVSAEHNFFSLSPQFQCFFGLTPWMDINIIPQFFYNRTHGQSSVNFGDFVVGLDFQLLDPAATPYFPGIKLAVRETFPTGPFEHLNPRKLLTDQSGAGTFATTFDLILYQVYHLKGHHFLSTTYSAAYTITSPVHVHGFNVYGGGFGTNGKAMPGNNFQGIISFELSLSQNWVLALDNVYTHVDRTQFCGDVGTVDGLPAAVGVSPLGQITVAPAIGTGLPATIGSPSSEQISFAPAIEYNFSSHFGIIAGCWFTAWGRNSTQFRSGVINFDYTY